MRPPARKYQAPIGGLGWVVQILSRPDVYDGLLRQRAVQFLHHFDAHVSQPQFSPECALCMKAARRATA